MMRQLLVFPLSVVVLAFASFVFGGHCAAWQWWLAVAIALASGFWRRSARDGVRSGLFFIAWLLLFWIGCGVFMGAAWWDEVTYHYPGVRMLADGWNPLWDSTPEAALKAVGLCRDDLWIDHVVFMPKIVWTFDAVAWFFTRDVLNPLSPILWFLFPAVVGRIWRSLPGVHFAWRLLAVPVLYCIVPNAAYAVDSVVALSAIGLFLSFEEILSGRGFDLTSLIAYSFWMLGAKTPGLLHGGFFWIVFLVAVMWKRRGDFKRLLCAIVPIVLLLALANSSPYLTSIRNYGHPFYPKYSFDEKRFPIRDLTFDFLTRRNEDAAKMGYFGLYVNAFISPQLAHAWYRWRLNRPDCMPYSRNYTHYPHDAPDGASPTRRSMRCLCWLSMAWLLRGAGKAWRIPALSVLLCMGAAPAPMLGYLRYIPWWLSPALFAYIDFARRREAWKRRLFCVVTLVFTCSVRPHTLSDRLVYAATLVERRGILAEMFEGAANPPALRAVMTHGLGQLKLMFRHSPYMTEPKLLPHSRKHREVSKKEGLEIAAVMFLLDDLDLMRQQAFHYPEGKLRRATYLARTYFVTVPCAVADRIASLWRRDWSGERKKGDAK